MTDTTKQDPWDVMAEEKLRQRKERKLIFDTVGEMDSYTLRDVMHCVRAALVAQAAAVPQWQQIETAPRDGTSILIIDASAGKPDAGIAHWANEWRGGSAGDWKGTRSPQVYFGVYLTPTHWMPLPAAPSLAAAPPAPVPGATASLDPVESMLGQEAATISDRFHLLYSIVRRLELRHGITSANNGEVTR